MTQPICVHALPSDEVSLSGVLCHVQDLRLARHPTGTGSTMADFPVALLWPMHVTNFQTGGTFRTEFVKSCACFYQVGCGEGATLGRSQGMCPGISIV